MEKSIATSVPPVLRQPSVIIMTRVPTECDSIRDVLWMENFNKWGFVIVRCTYTDQKMWATFMSMLREQANKFLEDDKMLEDEEVAEKDVESDLDLEKFLQWTVIEDYPRLENATIRDATIRFHEWLQTDGKKEREGMRERDFSCQQDYTTHLYMSRYDFFLYVDSEVVNSVVNHQKLSQAPNLLSAESTPAHIKIVNYMVSQEDSCSEESRNGEEDIFGEDDLSWMQIRFDSAFAFYGALQNYNSWFSFWVSPPEVVDY